MRHLALPIGLLATAVLAAGCSGLLVPDRPAPSLWELSPVPAAIAAVDIHLVVAEPRVPAALDTNRIAVRPRPRELRYLADGRWADRLPRLLHTVLMRSLEDGGFAGVSRESDGPGGDLLLQVEIRTFHLDVTGERPRAQLELAASLSSRDVGAPVAATRLQAGAPADSRRAVDLVAACDRALGDLLRELAAWLGDEAAGVSSGAAADETPDGEPGLSVGRLSGGN